MTGAAAWLVIVGYEYRCPRGQMLCEVLDPAIAKHPVLTRAAILYTALHVANLLPPRFDVFSQLATRLGR